MGSKKEALQAIGAPKRAFACTAVMSLPRQTAQTNSLIAELVGSTEELPPGVANTITRGTSPGTRGCAKQPRPGHRLRI